MTGEHRPSVRPDGPLCTCGTWGCQLIRISDPEPPSRPRSGDMLGVVVLWALLMLATITCIGVGAWIG